MAIRSVSNIDSLADEIFKALRMYNVDVKEKVKDITDEVSADLVQQLKQTSPKDTGDYAKSWMRTKKGTKYIIHVRAPHYRLTHLLEKGHAKTGGGRVGARVHIAPAEQRAIQRYLDKVERVLEQ